MAEQSDFFLVSNNKLIQGGLLCRNHQINFKELIMNLCVVKLLLQKLANMLL